MNDGVVPSETSGPVVLVVLVVFTCGLSLLQLYCGRLLRFFMFPVRVRVRDERGFFSSYLRRWIKEKSQESSSDDSSSLFHDTSVNNLCSSIYHHNILSVLQAGLLFPKISSSFIPDL